MLVDYSSSYPIKAVIELKTPWTLFLDHATITSAEPARRSLEIPLGKLSVPLASEMTQLKNQQDS
jgi:hypothetical protein